MDYTTDMERASRLIEAATGEPWGDGYTVTDVGIGNASYPNDPQGVWVMGNWNPKRYPHGDDTPLSNEENIGPRLANALAKYANAELLWLDEWARCVECAKAVRITADSYSWSAQYVQLDGEIICATDATFDDVAEEAIDNPSYAVPTFIDLETEGFQQYNGRYESGWHPGQDDNPEAITNEIRLEGVGLAFPDSEIVFQIESVGQFDMTFKAYTRERE